MNHAITANEAGIIAQARIEAVEDVRLPMNGGTAVFCGSCGRIIHHPNCSRYEYRVPDYSARIERMGQPRWWQWKLRQRLRELRAMQAEYDEIERYDHRCKGRLPA
jgi:hypothetical protein